MLVWLYVGEAPDQHYWVGEQVRWDILTFFFVELSGERNERNSFFSTQHKHSNTFFTFVKGFGNIFLQVSQFFFRVYRPVPISLLNEP